MISYIFLVLELQSTYLYGILKKKNPVRSYVMLTCKSLGHLVLKYFEIFEKYVWCTLEF